MTDPQRDAWHWLHERGGTGVFCRDGVLLAGGERAPVMRSTWNALVDAGLASVYEGGRRLALGMEPAGRPPVGTYAGREKGLVRRMPCLDEWCRDEPVDPRD